MCLKIIPVLRGSLDQPVQCYQYLQGVHEVGLHFSAFYVCIEK